jgi:hypothetical protein
MSFSSKKDPSNLTRGENQDTIAAMMKEAEDAAKEGKEGRARAREIWKQIMGSPADGGFDAPEVDIDEVALRTPSLFGVEGKHRHRNQSHYAAQVIFFTRGALSGSAQQRNHARRNDRTTRTQIVPGVFYRVDPNCETWPNTLIENPY